MSHIVEITWRKIIFFCPFSTVYLDNSKDLKMCIYAKTNCAKCHMLACDQNILPFAYSWYFNFCIYYTFLNDKSTTQLNSWSGYHCLINWNLFMLNLSHPSWVKLSNSNAYLSSRHYPWKLCQINNYNNFGLIHDLQFEGV